MGKGLVRVRDIYLDGIAGGNARAAVLRNTGHRYTQHSTGVGDGAEGFLAFFEPFVARNPKRDIEIVRIFEDGPWVFCNAYQSLNGGEARWVTMDMFYTDPDGMLLEHWDTIAPFVAATASGADMVGGSKEINLGADTASSQALVLEYTKQVRLERRFDKLPAFVSAEIVQHAAHIGAGLEGLAAWLATDEAGDYEMLFHLMGQGDFVMTYGKRHAQSKDIAVFDLYRVAGGKIVEHWMNEEEIGPRESWGNAGKF